MSMVKALRRAAGLMAGAAAIVLTATPVVPLPAARTITDTDPIVTGSIAWPQAPVPRERSAASADFRRALELLDTHDWSAAYALARGIDDDTERRIVQWAAIYSGRGEIDYRSVLRFSTDAPAFSGSAVFRTRLEQALIRVGSAGADVIALLGGSMPNTVPAQVALALAYFEDGQRERAAGIARAIWTGNFLDRAGEAQVLRLFGDLLDGDAHWARAVHLMMHDRARGVERLLEFLSPAQRSLAIARNAVSREAEEAGELLDAVDPALRTHPVYYFSRAQRARALEQWEEAVAWLDKAEGAVPDAAVWWDERRWLARHLLDLGKPELAYRAAAGYRHGPEGRLVEARFHAGWIALAFLEDPERALKQFEAMRALSTLPDSITQSNYWLGRARLALGDKLGSNAAFAAAARYSTVYYGQLARAELGMTGVHLRGMPAWHGSAAAFEAREVVQAVRLLASHRRPELAESLLRQFARGLEDGGELVLAARLAQEIGTHHLAIEIAGSAERRGVPLDAFSFPKDGLPSARLTAVDMAAVYAVTRQESHFRADAVSGAGARGLMQLMPATAEETATRLGLAYSPSRLTSDPAYNALLGSTYLAAQLQRFEGSLLLAAAAYNAGAGNASKWIEAFGDPRSTDVDPVLWVERIPFHETRQYVQRVLGNYLVYRARLGHDDLDMSRVLRRIPGWDA